MNKTFNLVWSAARSAYIVAHECAKFGGRPSGLCQQVRTASLVLGLLGGTGWALAGPPTPAVPAVNALPTGGQVAAGSASIAQIANRMDVTQSSQKAILNWQSFNIGSAAQVNFAQPNASAVALNRVLSSDPSAIYGKLTANGQVFLVNQSGVLFGAGSRVDVGGLVASTKNVSDADFMAGRYAFSSTLGNTGLGSVPNLGNITAAQGGYVALLSPEVRNEGIISASLGQVVLGAADAVTLSIDASGLQYAVDQGAVQALVDNKGLVQAEGGQVILSARAANTLASAVINNSGTIEAKGLSSVGGKIVLEASGEGTGNIFQEGTLTSGVRIELNATQFTFNTGHVTASNGTTGGTIAITTKNYADSGTLDASGTQTGGSIRIAASGGAEQASVGLMKVDGGTTAGSIRLTVGESAYLSGQFTANASNGNGGDIAITAPDLNLYGARLHADGAETGHGGSIKLGGGWQGGDVTLANANTVYVDANTQISVNAGKVGAGGTAVVWSEQRTDFAGSIQATGGSTSGDGGQVEISSHDTLAFAGTVNASATEGIKGNLLLDPKNITIETTVSAGFTAQTLAAPSNATGQRWSNGTPLELSNGNILVGSYAASSCGTNCGAIRMFSPTGSLIATYTGSNAYDYVDAAGSITGIPAQQLPNGNVVLRNSIWGSVDGTANMGRGAVTWINGTTGALSTGAIGGAISASNSLVGNQAGGGGFTGNRVGNSGIVVLTGSSNFIVGSQSYSWSPVADADRGGALSWMNGSTGKLADGSNGGIVDTPNSLIGTGGANIGMQLGYQFANDGYRLALSNGNFVYGNSSYDNGKGYVVWMNGDGSTLGVVNTTRAYIGQTNGVYVGLQAGLSNGNYVIGSSLWNSGAGFAMWMNGGTGKNINNLFYEATSSSNALIGTGDMRIGAGVLALDNGRYAIRGGSPTFGNSSITWADDSAGTGSGTNVTGTVSASTSFFGGGDSNGMVKLSNGNYVYYSNNGTFNGNGYAGFTTWFDGTTGYAKGDSQRGATPTLTNSMGGHASTMYAASTGVTPLADGTYLIRSQNYANNSGAYTWCSASGCAGTISNTNSVMGAWNGDQVGSYAPVVLSNNNIVLFAPNARNTTNSVQGAGAIAWMNGTTGQLANGNYGGYIDNYAISLVGSQLNDQVGSGGVYALTGNGNYVVSSPYFSGERGAVTWGNGSTGTVGVLSTINSLFGTTQFSPTVGDRIGAQVTVLTNGNYVASSEQWGANKGAATWFNGSNGHMADWTSGNIGGTVSASNSLIGAGGGDMVGLTSGGQWVAALPGGNYVVRSQFGNLGAVTWGSGSSGVVGSLSTTHPTTFYGRNGDNVAGNGTWLFAAPSGDYWVSSTSAYNATATVDNAGAVTWFNGSNGFAMNESIANAVLSSNNSFFGSDQAGFNFGIASHGKVLTVGANAGGLVVGDQQATVSGFTNSGVTYFYKPSAAAPLSGDLLYATSPSADNALTATQLKTILDNGTSLTLQANNDITVNTDVIVNNAGGNGGHLTLQAGRNLTFNANVTTDNGNLTAIAGDSGANATYTSAGTPILTIAGGKTLNVGTGTATLVARGGNFVNNAGASGITTSGAGRYLVYAADPSTSTEGMTGYNKHYAQNYTGSVPSYAGSGNWFLYSVSPSLSVTPGAASMTYGDANPTFTASYTGYIDGDVLGTSGISGTATYTVGGSTSTGGRYTFGSHDLTYSTGLLSSLGYTFTNNAGSSNELSVTKRDMTLSGLSVAGKTYDGTNTASITGTASVSPLSSDVVNLSGTVTGGTFASTHAGTHAVTVTGLSGITGADSGNYNFVSSFSATIGQRTVTPTLSNTGVTKTYNGNTSAPGGFTPTWTWANLLSGDTLNLANTGIIYNSKDVATANQLTVSGLSHSINSTTNSSLAGDYVLDATSKNVAATVTAKTVSLAASKTYDGNVNLATVTVTTGVGVETLNYSAATTASKNVGAGNYLDAITLSSGTGDVSNYALPSLTAASGSNAVTINAKALTLSGSKTYDGTTVLTGFVTLGGLISGETLSITSATASNSHVATANKYVSAIALANGTGGGVTTNYSLPALSYSAGVNSLTINARTVGLTATKTYDGNTSLTGAVTVTTGVSGEALNYTGATASSKDVATANKYINAITLTNGTGIATDYALPTLDAANAQVTINAKTVSLTAAKTYDGSTDMTGTVTITTGVGSETLTYTGATASDANVATASKFIDTITLTDGTNGGAASNYALPSLTAASGSNAVTINTKALTLTGSKTYDGTTNLLSYVTLGGLIDSETLSITAATGSNNHVATANKYVSAITLANGTNGGVTTNYSLPAYSYSAGVNSLTISTKTLTPTITNTGVTKVYDGTLTSSFTPTYSFAGLVSGDTDATLTNTGKNYNTKDVLTADQITVSGLAISGVTGSNSSATSDYVLDASSKTVAATITAKPLTISGLAADPKTYNALTDVTITNWGNVTTGVNTETLVLNHGTASFGDKTKANGKTVTAIGYSLADGTNLGVASNYSLTSTSATTTANITAKTITLAGSTGVTKTYDGRTSMMVGTNGFESLVGVESGDAVTIAGAPVFSSANQGARSIVQNNVAIAGTDAGNYTLAWSDGSGTINPAPLTVRANADANFVTQASTGAAAYNGASYSGLVNGETTAVLGLGGLTITRNASGPDGNTGGVNTLAGTYTNALTPSGVTANNGNYSISYAPGTYTIVASDRLLVRVQNTSSTYGTAAGYTLTSAEYFNGSAAVPLSLTGVNPGTNFSLSDGAGGSAIFTLGPVSPQSSTNGALKAGSYSIGASNVTETSGNFNNNLVVVGALTVNQKALTANASNVSKVYDGSTATTNVVLGYTGLETNDLVTISGNGNFSNKNVGTDKSYTVSSLTLGSVDAANYYLAGGSDLTGNNGDVTAKTVSLSGARTYDGSKTLGAGTVTITTGVAGEALTYSNATSASKNVGANYIDAFTLVDEAGATATAGGLASNYQLPSLTGTSADNSAAFTQKSLAISGITAADKVYDGNNVAAVSTAAVVKSGLVTGDDLSLGATGTFSDKNAANGKTVTLVNTYGGTDLGNYTVTGQTSTTASISKKALAISGITAADKVYDGNNVAAVSTAVVVKSGLVGGDDLSVGATGTFSDKNAASGKTVTLVSTHSGADVNNYSITDQASTTASITPKDLTLDSVSAANKTYDGLTKADVTLGNLVGLVGSESLGLSGKGDFENANVGIDKTVLVQLALADSTNGLASNYSIQNTTTKANINPVPNVVPPLPPSVPTTPLAPLQVPSPNPPPEPPAASPNNPTGGSSVPLTGVPGGTGGIPTGTPAPGGDPIAAPATGGSSGSGSSSSGRTTSSGSASSDAPESSTSPNGPASLPVQFTLLSTGESPPGAKVPDSSGTAVGDASTAGFISVRNFDSLEIPDGSLFSFTLPKDTFKHADPKASVVLEARGENGPLPEWLSFDRTNGKFTGRPPKSLTTFTVIVTARDSSGNEASIRVVLNFTGKSDS